MKSRGGGGGCKVVRYSRDREIEQVSLTDCIRCDTMRYGTVCYVIAVQAFSRVRVARSLSWPKALVSGE